MRHLDLFSGIGGFALAARMVGIETIGFSEIESYCCKLLTRNFPGIPNYGDITQLDGRTITADLITGGFPCQPFSLAGKQAGQDDERHLWPEMRRVIEESKPTWVLGENVPGLIGLALERVCLDLESLGFEVQPVVIPACAVNAPHRRDRVWILAYSESNRRGSWRQRGSDSGSERQSQFPLHVVSDTQGNGMERSQRQDRRANGGSRRPGGLDALRGGTSPADATSNLWRASRDDGPESSDGSRAAVADSASQQVGNAGQSWVDGSVAAEFRLTQPPLCGRDDGVSHRVDRLRGLGNAIVPQVAAVIMRAMKESVWQSKC